MGREDVKRVRRKLRWFTFIVTVLAGVNSYFSGSLAEANGTTATGLGGAFLTALFILIAVLIFISIPFNILAFFVVHSNRYPDQAFRKINRVLTWVTVIFSLLLGIYCYFSGITAGNLKIVGVGGAIYAVIFMVLLMIIFIAIPVHLVSFIVFAIRGPRNFVPPVEPRPQKAPDLLPRTEEIDRVFQQQSNSPATLPDMKALFEAQDQNEWKKAISQFAHTLDKGTLTGSIALALMRDFGFSEKEADEEALKWSEVLGEVSSQSANFVGKWDQFVLHKTPEQTPEEILKRGGIKIVRQLLKEYQKELHE